MSKTLTGLFDHYSDATAAVSELERLGVPHDDLSIVANQDGDHDHGTHGVTDLDDHGDVSRGTSTGAVLGGGAGLLAGLGLLAIPGLGPIVAAGWLAAMATGAGIGAAGGAATGGIVGALKNAGHSDEESHVYSEGVRRGGTLVSARVPDDLVAEAQVVLQRKAVDATARGGAYRQEGWTSFDESAPAYSSDQQVAERARYTTGQF